MSTTEANDDSESNAPVLNGHALDSLDGVEAALGYLKKTYNDGNLVRRDDGSMIITARGSKFQYMEHFLKAHRDQHINMRDVYSRNGKMVIELTRY